MLAGKPAFSWADSPKNGDAFLNCREVSVTSGEKGLAIGGKGGGVTIGIREFVFGAQLGRSTR